MEFAANIRINGHDIRVSISDDGWSRIWDLTGQAYWQLNPGRWPLHGDYEYHTEDGRELNPGTLLRRSGLKSGCTIVVNKPIGNGA